jgi:hypothetical protein
MSVALTPRQIEIATRFMTRQNIRMERFRMERSPDEDYLYKKEITINEKIKFEVSISNLEEEDEDFDESCEEHTQFVCVLEFFSYLEKDEKKCLDVYWSSKCVNRHFTIKDFHLFIEEINKLVKCKQCSCNFVDEGDMEYCDRCDPFIVKHDDDCAICISNTEGIWIKTTCNHEFHLKCFNKIDMDEELIRKCPLCRNKIKCGDTIKL